MVAPKKLFSPKRALAAFKADLTFKKTDAFLNSNSYLNDFIAESKKEEEYSPEKPKQAVPVRDKSPQK